jgi:hypothetical protein
MGAGLIQLVAYGIQDIFITGDPQITFFKVMYRRHTNFSIEPIPQFFNTSNTNNIRFGQKISCTLSRTADLINKIYLVVDLPIIPAFTSKNCSTSLTNFAWARKIGYAILNTVEIEIGGQLIDRQYGTWMYIWDELTNRGRYSGYKFMIGDIPELTSFTNGKNTYTLCIPLQFWFCKYSNLSLPIVALQYNEVKINIEFSEQTNCYLLGPTQSINIMTPLVHFTPGEWIQQTVGTNVAYGIFTNYDIPSGTLYYIRASDASFQSLNTTTISSTVGVNASQLRTNYTIYGLCSGYTVLPTDGVTEQTITINVPALEKLIIPNCYLDVEYVYLDVDERFRFINTAHEYLIEQVQIGAMKNIQFKSIQINLTLNHPCRALFWVAQLGTCVNVNDTFNFTNSVVRDLNTDKLCGTNLVISSQLILNSVPRFTVQPGTYFNWIQPYQYFQTNPEEGVNVYNFGLGTGQYQPAGTCNMSKMDFISLKSSFDPTAITNGGSESNISVYALSYNILRIINGLGGLLFSN